MIQNITIKEILIHILIIVCSINSKLFNNLKARSKFFEISY
jgi:hypothetical protein